MAERENPLDIDYSLRIGTSIYHVLGKRRKSRGSQYDYYVMDEKLIRSKSNKQPTRPRYIVDEPDRNAKEPPKSTPVDVEEIKHALVETMEAEREKILASLRATVVEENEAAAQANQKREMQSADLIRRTIRETLSAQKDEERRLKELFDEQKQTMSAILEQQQEQAKTTSADRIEAAVIKALESQQNQQQQSVSKEDIQELENKLSRKIQEMVDGYKKIKIYNDLDIRAFPYNEFKQMQQEQKSKTDAESSNNRSSTKTKQAPADTSTQDQSEISHKRAGGLESKKSND
jgi:hypothetical protein